MTVSVVVSFFGTICAALLGVCVKLLTNHLSHITTELSDIRSDIRDMRSLFMMYIQRDIK